MKDFTLLLLFASMMLTSSCKFLLFKYEGVKEPALENHASLSKFLSSKRIDTSEILCLRDIDALNNFYLSKIGTPDALFFNREKKMVDYRSSVEDCNGMVPIFIDKGDSINLVKPIEGEYLDKYLEPIAIEKSGKKFILDSQDYDVYMVVYWAKYLGKVSKRKVYEWQEHLKKANQNGQKMRMILVSVDYQQFWGITKDQIPEFGF